MSDPRELDLVDLEVEWILAEGFAEAYGIDIPDDEDDEKEED